jgi:hypothetical protein
MLSVAQTIQHQIINLKGWGRKQLWTEVLSQHLAAETEKITKTPQSLSWPRLKYSEYKSEALLLKQDSSTMFDHHKQADHKSVPPKETMNIMDAHFKDHT